MDKIVILNLTSKIVRRKIKDGEIFKCRQTMKVKMQLGMT